MTTFRRNYHAVRKRKGGFLKYLLLLALVLPAVLIGMTTSLGYAQEPEEPFLVKDIYPGPESSEAGSDYDGNPAVANGMFFFIADGGSHGGELWRSDGTDTGTLQKNWQLFQPY